MAKRSARMSLLRGLLASLVPLACASQAPAPAAAADEVDAAVTASGGRPGKDAAPGDARAAAGGMVGAGGTGGGAASVDGATTADTAPASADATAGAADSAMAASDAGPPAGGSPGCGKPALGGERTVTIDGLQRIFAVFLPKSYDPDRPYPLVFYLHGRGDHPETAPEHSADLIEALSDRAILVYPRALSSGWEEKEDQHTRMLKLIKQQVMDSTCVDAKRFVVAGFSSGGWLTSMVGCTMADEIAGIVIASAGLKRRCAGKQPALVIAALQEPDFGAARAAADYLRTRNGCTATTMPAAVAPCASYQGCAPGFSATFCPWDGTHLWPTTFGGRAVADFLSRL